MKKITAKKVFFRFVKHVSTSFAGNPKYEACMVLPNGDSVYGKTATDSSSAYGIKNYESYTGHISCDIDGETWYREVENIPRYADVTYHVTASGNIIFDYITDHKEDGAA